MNKKYHYELQYCIACTHSQYLYVTGTGKYIPAPLHSVLYLIVPVPYCYCTMLVPTDTSTQVRIFPLIVSPDNFGLFCVPKFVNGHFYWLIDYRTLSFFIPYKWKQKTVIARILNPSQNFTSFLFRVKNRHWKHIHKRKPRKDSFLSTNFYEIGDHHEKAFTNGFSVPLIRNEGKLA